MRYLLQGLTMLSDIIVWTVVICMSAFCPTPIIWLLAALVIRTWWKTGGFEAWRPSTIRRFLKNARRYGL